MQRTSQRSSHLSSAAKGVRGLCCILCLSMACVLFSPPLFAFEFGDVMRSFSSDFNRSDALQMKGQFVSAISGLSGMKPANDVQIVFKGRGDVSRRASSGT